MPQWQQQALHLFADSLILKSLNVIFDIAGWDAHAII